MAKKYLLDKSTCLSGIKISNNGLNLFYFPMFLMPISIFNEMENNIQYLFKNQEIMKKVGFLQGFFSISYLKNFHNIKFEKNNLNLFFDQIRFKGLCSIKEINLFENNEKIELKIEKTSKYQIEKNSYFQGLIEGIFYNLFESQFIFSNQKILTNEIVISIRKTTKNNYPYSPKYLLKNMTLSYINEVSLFNKAADNIFFVNIIRNEILNKNRKYIFSPISILAKTMILCESISTKKSEKLFKKLGKNLLIYYIENNKDYFKKCDLYNLNNFMDIIGIGGFDYIITPNKILISLKYCSLNIIYEKLSFNYTSPSINSLRKSFLNQYLKYFNIDLDIIYK